MRLNDVVLGLILSVFAAIADPALAQVRVVVIGDSNVAGTGVGDDARYPAQLEAALRRGGLNVTVANAGINGDTVQGVANRLDSAVPSGTHVVVVWVGINDRRLGRDRDTIRAQLQSLAARIRSRGMLVHTVTPGEWWPVRLQPDTTLGAGGVMWRGQPDPHFNRRGYALVVQRTLGPVRRLVQQAGRRVR